MRPKAFSARLGNTAVSSCCYGLVCNKQAGLITPGQPTPRLMPITVVHFVGFTDRAHAFMGFKFANPVYQDGRASNPLGPWLSRLTRWAWPLLLLVVMAAAGWALWLRVQHRGCVRRPYLGGADLVAGRDVHAGLCDVCLATRPGLDALHRPDQYLSGLRCRGDPVPAVEPLVQS